MVIFKKRNELGRVGLMVVFRNEASGAMCIASHKNNEDCKITIKVLSYNGLKETGGIQNV